MHRVREVVEEFYNRGLLTYASAIAFQTLFAIIPFVCFALALLGFLHLSDVYSRDVAPSLARNVSAPIYSAIDQSVRNVLTHHQVFWLTAGLLIAWWEVSGAVRAVMSAFDVIYAERIRRTLVSRTLASLWLSAVVGVCWGAAFAVLYVPLDGGLLLTLGRGALALGLLSVAVGSLVRWAPAVPRPLPYVSLGAGAAVALSLLTSVGYWLYLTKLASYSTIFGNLATVIVLMSFLYLTAIAFLAGTLIDALARERNTAGAQRRDSAAAACCS